MLTRGVVAWPEGRGGRSAVAGLHPGFSSVVGKVVYCNRVAFVCACLGPLVLIGIVAEPEFPHWRGTRINAEGKLKPREVAIPDYCRDFLASS